MHIVALEHREADKRADEEHGVRSGNERLPGKRTLMTHGHAIVAKVRKIQNAAEDVRASVVAEAGS